MRMLCALALTSSKQMYTSTTSTTTPPTIKSAYQKGRADAGDVLEPPLLSRDAHPVPSLVTSKPSVQLWQRSADCPGTMTQLVQLAGQSTWSIWVVSA